MPIAARTARSALLIAVATAVLAAGGCAVSSPTTAAIQRGDARATDDEQRVAPMAARRRGLLVAGDGFGRMAYTSSPSVSTASVDPD